MNRGICSGLFARLYHSFFLSTQRIGVKPVCEAFNSLSPHNNGFINQIYVINLDRQVNRWIKIKQELSRYRDISKIPLTEMTKRFSAVDSRYNAEIPSNYCLQVHYALENQLFVEPDPLIDLCEAGSNLDVTMSQQEIAVALSHISIWKQIASSNIAYSLVLEDDVFFRRSFSQVLPIIWDEVINTFGPWSAFDILYLSYKEAKSGAEWHIISDNLLKPIRGLWWLSGYVMSKNGAKKLLELLPVTGPVDLWINHQFDKLEVYAAKSSIIDQRLDCHSDNKYSILPTLSKLGVIINEKPLLYNLKNVQEPIFAYGSSGTNLTSLAMALSMLGYRCCSDINELPEGEHNKLFNVKKGRVFNAYINVGTLFGIKLIKLAKLYSKCKFIIVVKNEQERIKLKDNYSENNLHCLSNALNQDEILCIINNLLSKLSASILVIPETSLNKWDMLSNFLKCKHPDSCYPTMNGQSQRILLNANCGNKKKEIFNYKRMKYDKLPWIVAPRKKWEGMNIVETNGNKKMESNMFNESDRFSWFNSKLWVLIEDTFPDNLAVFRARNFSISEDDIAILKLQKEKSLVREYTSASICSNRRYLNGRFSAMIKPTKTEGLITGMFLHRNSPRQEIDIEFLGKDPRKMLVNVFYNPGDDGASFEYGYRGTPVLINLDFDVSENYHKYTIEWLQTSISWFIDDRLVYKRVNWDPTPIPHLPMNFYINLWYSRSEELSGKLLEDNLPAYSTIKTIDIQYNKTQGADSFVSHQ